MFNKVFTKYSHVLNKFFCNSGKIHFKGEKLQNGAERQTNPNNFIVV